MQIINEGIYIKKVRQTLLLVQLLLLFVPSFQFFSIRTDNGAIPASACYFFSLVFVPCMVKRIRTLRLPPWYLTMLCLYVFFLAAIRIPKYGLSKAILHWAFGFYLLVVILNVGADFQREDWLHMLETGACVFAVVHVVFILLLHNDLVWYLLKGYFTGEISGNEGVILPSLTRGGRNLDCSWLGLGAFFVRGRKKAVYVTYTALFSCLGCSRVGVIAIGLVILWSLVFDPLYHLTVKNLKWYAVYAAAMLVVLFGSGMAQAFLGRSLIEIAPPAAWFGSGRPTETVHIQSSNMETVLSGRAAIWRNVPQMFRDEPFGYGVGNAMRVMKSDYGFTSYEDVVHNVLFQWLLDEGALGGIWYVGLVYTLLRNQWKEKAFFTDPIAAYLLVYVILSLVQFHGGEALMIFVLGIYLLVVQAKCIQIILGCKSRGQV